MKNRTPVIKSTAIPETLENRRSVLDDDLLYRRLSDERYEILKDLVNLRATTPSRFAVDTGRFGQDLKAQLDDFVSEGLAEREEQNGQFNESIYTPIVDAIRFVTRTEREKSKKTARSSKLFLK